MEESGGILLARLTHAGSSNFIVHPVDPGGAEQASIVDEIGSYQGTVIVNEDVGKVLRGFKIKADGAWTLTLKPLTMARPRTGARASGRGDDVLLLSPAATGLTTVKANHSGSSNVIVYACTDNLHGNLVNKIGSYRGEVLLPDGTSFVTVHADGRWTFIQEWPGQGNRQSLTSGLWGGAVRRRGGLCTCTRTGRPTFRILPRGRLVRHNHEAGASRHQGSSNTAATPVNVRPVRDVHQRYGDPVRRRDRVVPGGAHVD